ncbi:hypothetical protein F4561_003151 [Lipingzhangella halophila]|uniref:Uncharacterized protein n=1 Tax=Lipingzhangella halophila TaxID=1783352 RepID=A0A7W7RHX8_9ACTN|nr:hypothetical protein [Lipingzhangella halophila]MBB4932331.1 hypothetical protein [Lipingzhangella halophila]
MVRRIVAVVGVGIGLVVGGVAPANADDIRPYGKYRPYGAEEYRSPGEVWPFVDGARSSGGE